jgi:hypothetical protein
MFEQETRRNHAVNFAVDWNPVLEGNRSALITAKRLAKERDLCCALQNWLQKIATKTLTLQTRQHSDVTEVPGKAQRSPVSAAKQSTTDGENVPMGANLPIRRPHDFQAPLLPLLEHFHTAMSHSECTEETRQKQTQ